MKKFSKTHILSSAALAAALLTGPAISVPANAAGGHDYASIRGPGESPKTRAIDLAFGKSTIVELPQEMMDVIISSPDIVEGIVHTAHRVMLIGKKVGVTNAYIYGHDGEELLNLEIRVDRDMNGLQSLLNKHLPDNELEVQAINDNILMSGPIPNAAAMDKAMELARIWLDEQTGAESANARVVNLMSMQGRDQVMLKVRIVEMQRSVTKQMGINLNAIGNLGSSTVSLFSNNSLATGAGLTGALNYTNSGGGDLRSLGGALQALERVGLVRTKAEPTLVAVSGETANFQSGGEFPLLTNVFLDEAGQVQREFTFKPYGVSLGFTPTVMSEGNISLNISTEVSEPTTEGSFETGGVGSDILGLRVRKANTVVELPAGESLVIAGLIREEARQSSDGNPGMKDIPGIGALFRNRDDLSTQTELVIMVTPYLVDGVHPDKLSTPLDGYTPPSDREALLLGRLNKVYSAPGASTGGRTLQGPFGHVVD